MQQYNFFSNLMNFLNEIWLGCPGNSDELRGAFNISFNGECPGDSDELRGAFSDGRSKCRPTKRK